MAVSENSFHADMFNREAKKQFKYFNETPNEKAAAIFREWEKDLLERVNK
jgi:hypothetical protein